MAARDDYPKLSAWSYTELMWPADSTASEMVRALDEIDRLRAELDEVRTVILPSWEAFDRWLDEKDRT